MASLIVSMLTGIERALELVRRHLQDYEPAFEEQFEDLIARLKFRPEIYSLNRASFLVRAWRWLTPCDQPTCTAPSDSVSGLITSDDEKTRAQETGEKAHAIPFLKRLTVFNVAQCRRSA